MTNLKCLSAWIIDDDFEQARVLKNVLHVYFDAADISTFHTTCEAIEAIRSSSSSSHPPDIIITDLMLCWDRPSPDAMQPQENWRMDLAGISLIREIRGNPILQNVPIILWSVTERFLPDAAALDSVIVINKARGDADTMVRAIRSALISQGKTPVMKDNTWSRLVESAELKPGIFGFRVDLKKLIKALTLRKRTRK